MSYSISNNQKTDDKLKYLESKLFNKLDFVDYGTSISIKKIIDKENIQNKVDALQEFNNRIEIALDYVDVRMLNSTYHSIKDTAKAISKVISRLSIRDTNFDADMLVEQFYSTENTAIKAPKINTEVKITKDKYYLCIKKEEWWLKKLLKIIEQNREILQLLMGLVNEQSPYASDLAVKTKKAADKRKVKYLEESFIISKKTGKEIKLSTLVPTKEQEFSEKWCIIKGLDEYSVKHGMLSAMITITAPSEFHLSPSNQSQNTPAQANAYIAEKWSTSNKSILSLKQKFFGFHVTEATIKGVPHWHVIIYYEKYLKNNIQSILMRVFEVASLDNFLIKWQDTDRQKSTFLSYVAKSLVPSRLATANALQSKSNERIDSFRKLWCLRSIQFFGLPKGCVVAWRQARTFIKKEIIYQRAKEVIKHVKQNNFYKFLKVYEGGKIETLISEDKKKMGLKIYGFSIYKHHENNKKIVTNNQTLKVNTINYLNKVENNSNNKLKSDKNIRRDILSSFFMKKASYLTNKIKKAYISISNKLKPTLLSIIPIKGNHN